MNTLNKIITKVSLLLITALIVTSCASYDIVKFGKVEKAQKTITVPNAGFSMSEIKQALIKDGWKLKASEEGIFTEGTDDGSVKTRSKIYYKTRYRMIVRESVRMSQWVLKTYISVIDNKTNEEVLLITGDSNGAGGVSPSTTASKLVMALSEIEN